MSITYEINSNSDLFLRDGTIALVKNESETAQDVKTKLKTFLGEVFYNVGIGVPYFTVIFQKPFDKDLADSIIIQNIYTSRTVLNISSFQSSVDTLTRRYIINFTMTYNNNNNQTQNINISETFQL